MIKIVGINLSIL